MFRRTIRAACFAVIASGLSFGVSCSDDGGETKRDQSVADQAVQLDGKTGSDAPGEDAAGGKDAVVSAEAGNDGAATSGVSFSKEIQPIFAASCGSAGQCHNTSPGQAQLSLTTASAYAQLVNIDSTQCAGVKRVKPGDPGASHMYLKVKTAQSCAPGTTRMPPPPNTSLQGAKIDLIADWIKEGAKDN